MRKRRLQGIAICCICAILFLCACQGATTNTAVEEFPTVEPDTEATLVSIHLPDGFVVANDFGTGFVAWTTDQVHIVQIDAICQIFPSNSALASFIDWKVDNDGGGETQIKADVGGTTFYGYEHEDQEGNQHIYLYAIAPEGTGHHTVMITLQNVDLGDADIRDMLGSITFNQSTQES
jgi:hypothetical protein